MRVTVQVEIPRKPYNWVNVFPGRVIYADRELIVIKACGSHSFFDGHGFMKMAGFNRNHPHAKNVPERHGRWRILPSSVARIRAEFKLRRERRLEATRGTSQGSGSKGAPSRSAPRLSASKGGLRPKKARLLPTPRRES